MRRCCVKRAAAPGSTEWILGVGSLSLTVTSAGIINLGFTNQDGVGNGFVGTQQLCDGAWHTVEIDFTDNGTRVFVDGVRDTSLTLSQYPQPNSGGDIAIGARQILFTSGFGGKIDEVSFWNGNLHFDEDSYTPPAVPWTGSEDNLAALYHLDGDFTSSVATGGTGGWTLSGTMTIPPGTFRDFYITFNSLTTATLQSVGAGDA